MLKNIILITFLLLSCNKPNSFVYELNKINNEVLTKHHKTSLKELYNDKYITSLEESQEKIAKVFFLTHISQENIFIQDIFSEEHIRYALLEQIKYDIPASIKLAQAYLESKKNGIHEYSNHIKYTNNLFGIKGKGQLMTTHEFIKQTDLPFFNKNMILSSKKVRINNEEYIKLVIKDNFKIYENRWYSFRDHSIKLLNKRYEPLFTLPKDYKEWANKLGNVNNGGLGYATATNYGEVLINIIEKYHLYLLDY